MTTTPLMNVWKLYYHYDINKWTIDSYVLISTIKTVEDFWTLINYLKKNKTILEEHLFLMKNNILPIWECNENKNGGCWSFKIDIKQSLEIFTLLCSYLITESLLSIPELNNEINGITFTIKNSYNSIIQVWNINKKVNKISLFIPEILDKFNLDIIYRSHVPDY